MSNTWALQDAKARFSEVVRHAQQQKPQFISVRGKPAVVIISEQQYRALISPKTSLVTLFRQSPLMGLDLSLERDNSPNRDVEL